MSSQEVAEFVEEELEKNPLLAAEESEPESKEESSESEAKDGEDDSPQTAKIDDDWRDDTVYESEQYEARNNNSSNNFEDSESFESYTASKKSLREHLLEQLNLNILDPSERIIGTHLIDLVDESGYIKEDIAGIAAMLDCPSELIEATFAKLHTFEPTGICARTLGECLAIQLREKNRLDPAMQIMLNNLDLVGKNDLTALGKICGLDIDDIYDMCKEIRSLNPRPASDFAYEEAQAIIPDIFLKREVNDSWKVELNSDSLPKLLVNRQYYTQISGKTRDKQEKKYLSEQLASASWLVKALDSRANTILKVATEIVKQQDAFFRYGIKYLRPLTLKEVAANVELHESTVSRVTTSKYMLTGRGTYELKYFFNACLQSSSGGEGYSNKTVQHLIKELVDNEQDNILSDDAIAALLQDRGIDIARRTVAKYRDIIGIASSATRKRNKKSG